MDLPVLTVLPILFKIPLMKCHDALGKLFYMIRDWVIFSNTRQKVEMLKLLTYSEQPVAAPDMDKLWQLLIF